MPPGGVKHGVGYQGAPPAYPGLAGGQRMPGVGGGERGGEFDGGRPGAAGNVPYRDVPHGPPNIPFSASQSTTQGNNNNFPGAAQPPPRMTQAPTSLQQALSTSMFSGNANPLSGGAGGGAGGGGQFNEGSNEISDLPKDLQNLNPTMSEQELTTLLANKDIATSLAEDLLAHLTQSQSQDSKDSLQQQQQQQQASSQNRPTNQNTETASPHGNGPHSTPHSSSGTLTADSASQGSATPNLSSPRSESSLTSAQIKSPNPTTKTENVEGKLNELKVDTLLRSPKPCVTSPSGFNVAMSAKEVFEASKGLSK